MYMAVSQVVIKVAAAWTDGIAKKQKELEQFDFVEKFDVFMDD